MFVNPEIDVIPFYTTQAECDEALDAVEKEVKNVQYSNILLERKSERAIQLSSMIEADLEAAQTTKDSYDAVIPTLPVGSPVRQTLEDEVVKLNYKIFNLTRRAKNIGKNALIQFSVAKQGNDLLLTRYAAITAAINTKKASL
jgi:hypothetical protein